MTSTTMALYPFGITVPLKYLVSIRYKNDIKTLASQFAVVDDGKSDIVRLPTRTHSALRSCFTIKFPEQFPVFPHTAAAL